MARIIAENSGMTLHKLNGTSCGTGDIKAVLKDIGTLAGAGGILLYLDEIQYLNKKQQQSLLECIEDGSVTLIAYTLEMIQQVTRRTAMRYDREGDDHYDIVSAYQKSMRGSDPDAALHYLARLLEAGDLPSACRRLMVCACEDVGLAYPQIIPIVKAAIDAANMVGLPEARLPLADAVILVATSPKSNSAYDAINAAIADVQAGRTGPIPRQLQNKHYDGEDALVKGQNYKYAHDYAHHWVEQQYLPDAIKDVKYYTFGDNKNEQAARAYWAKIKGEENV